MTTTPDPTPDEQGPNSPANPVGKDELSEGRGGGC